MSRESCEAAVHEPFLEKERHDDPPHRTRRSRYGCGTIVLTLGNLLFLACNLLLLKFNLFQFNTDERCPAPSIQGLDRPLVKVLFRNLADSTYAGEPSTELDNAWDSLLKPMHIRVSKDELRHDNQESVKLTDGGGYLAWLGVFHELHCIRVLQKWNHPDYYYHHSNLSRTEFAHLELHVDHCVDVLRQASMCRADASLTTFAWHPNKTEPMFNATRSIHTCVDWKKFVDSMTDRVVSEEEIERLRNPLMVHAPPS